MTRLNVEDLEGRALLSANVVAVAAPGADAAVRVLDTGDSQSGPTASRLTDWSFQWGQWVVEPNGGNHGSIMGDGFGLDFGIRGPDRP
jgi:hypothetical protein